MDVKELLKGIAEGNFLALARSLTLVENNLGASAELLRTMNIRSNVPVIGITGPPGAGKSTLVNAIVNYYVARDKKVGILAVDPTSPFNHGSLLGDRIRMSQQFNHPNVYIRSVATRGALGGISTKTVEMVDVMRAAAFDLILVETVGVGQSELEIAGLADRTVVVLVPEGGDEIQHIKSGLMEIAEAFVVNKADREGADSFANNLKKIVRQHATIPVFKTTAFKEEGIAALCEWLETPLLTANSKKKHLMAEKAYRFIQDYRMRSFDKDGLFKAVSQAVESPDFNFYRFVDTWLA